MEPTTIDPVALMLDMHGGKLEPATAHIRRHLSDMQGMYVDSAAERALIAEENPLVYEVLQYDVPNDAGQLIACTTILYPGQVGAEYFMTKGHYHAIADRAEMYLGLHGSGIVLMQVNDRVKHLAMTPGTIAYVPPYWAHRSVNVGTENFVFLAIYPADAGHDYGTIERDGFARRILQHNGEPIISPA